MAKPLLLKGHMGSVEFDGNTVSIHKSMRGQVRIPLDQIAGIALVPAGIGMSGIRFDTSGGTTQRRIERFGSHGDIASDPQALTFHSGRKAEFAQFAAHVEAAISAQRSPYSRPPAPQYHDAPEAPQQPVVLTEIKAKRGGKWKIWAGSVVVAVIAIAVTAALTAPSTQAPRTAANAAPSSVAATPPAGCIPSEVPIATMNDWLDLGATQGVQLEATASLKADAGIYSVGRLADSKHTLLVWWEPAMPAGGGVTIGQPVDATTVQYSSLPGMTQLVDSSSPGYARVKLCLS